MQSLLARKASPNDARLRRPPKVPPLQVLSSLLGGIWGLESSWGVLEIRMLLRRAVSQLFLALDLCTAGASNITYQCYGPGLRTKLQYYNIRLKHT